VENQKALRRSEMILSDLKFLTSLISVMRALVVAMKLVEGESH
jgi:hypothetical protein